MALGSHSI